jgi:hypothetical protein
LNSCRGLVSIKNFFGGKKENENNDKFLSEKGDKADKNNLISTEFDAIKNIE